MRDTPLGRGRPEDIPQLVRDAFHSAQEDQWDSPPESLPDDSDEESDDIVAYNTTTSQYTTRTEWDRVERRDNCLAHRRRHRKRRHGPNRCRKKLNLPILEIPPRITPSPMTTGAARLIITLGRDTPTS